MHRSLTFRLTGLSMVWVTLALAFTGLMLSYFYEDHIGEHYDAHVFSHLKELVAASRFTVDREFRLESLPTDPRFHEPMSGWYWEIRQNGTSLARSDSLGEESLDIEHIDTPDAQHVHEISGPNKQRLRVQVLEFAVPGGSDPLIFLASAPVIPIVSDVENYESHVQLSLLVLGLGLLLAVILQVRVALRPLKAISKSISEVRAGRRQTLPRGFPSDVQPLVDELNRLLTHNAFLLRRARNQLGDLAHAVKNPLTVINNEARSMPEDQRQLVLDQTRNIATSIEHYLSRARTYGQHNVMGSRTPVRPVVEDLVFALQRIHKERSLEIHVSGLESCWFGGDVQDLEEMLGNLLDNACKWARHEVWLRGELNEERLLLIVEDDGPGIPADLYEQVVQRGFRLQEEPPGHGLGLAIVREMVELYGGSLILGRSEHGGLKAELNFMASW